MSICFGAREDNFTPEELISLINEIHNFPAKIENYLSQITRDVWVIVIFLYILEFVITGYLVFIINNKLEQRTNKKRQIIYDRFFIKQILDSNSLFKETIDWQEHLKIPEEIWINKDILEIKEALERAKSSELTEFIEPLELKLKELNNKLIILKHKKELDYIEARKYQEQKEIKELEQKKRMIEWQIQDDKRMFLQKLDTYNNRVFKKENLSKKEYQALIDDGFKQVNEFCVLEKKRISVLVKPFGNHTISHEFLVWSVKRLIKKTEGIKKIRETRREIIKIALQDLSLFIQVCVGIGATLIMFSLSRTGVEVMAWGFFGILTITSGIFLLVWKYIPLRNKIYKIYNRNR